MKQNTPAIILIVNPSGVSVMTDNTEVLTPEQRLGFDLLKGKVHHFAAGLIDYVTKLQQEMKGKAH